MEVNIWWLVLGVLIVLLFGCLAVTALSARQAWRTGHFAPDKGEVEKWAAGTAAVIDDEATYDAAVRYVTNSRALRRLGFVSGLLIPAAINAGTGLDLHLNGLVWGFTGYLVGAMVAELTVVRMQPAGARRAAVGARRLPEYLPRSMFGAEIVLTVVAVLLATVLAVLTVIGSGDAISVAHNDATGTSVVLSGVLAAVALMSVLRLQQHVVSRPQPFVDPREVATDDAMRSSTVRTIGAGGIGLLASLVAGQLWWFTAELTNSWTGAVMVALLVVTVVLAYGAPWWGQRSWRVRRAGVPRPGGQIGGAPS